MYSTRQDAQFGAIPIGTIETIIQRIRKLVYGRADGMPAARGMLQHRLSRGGSCFCFGAPSPLLWAFGAGFVCRTDPRKPARHREQGFQEVPVHGGTDGPLVWALIAYALIAEIPQGSLALFFSQIIVSFGYSKEQSLLLAIPGGLVKVAALWFGGYIAAKYEKRFLVGIAGLVFAITGMAMIIGCAESNKIGRLIGYYITNCSATGFIASLSIVSTNIAGYTKKTVCASLFMIFYSVGMIIGPQIFRHQDKPVYLPAKITILCAWFVCILCLVYIWAASLSRNKHNAAQKEAGTYEILIEQEFMDLTDRENVEFKYSV
ncbi:hypothetical protein V502_06795 [Pseudogymnoascus sp. VKM F-4520 (FW-2644)]|nr:hypothetical protein V502_06795 [Pseudogymnoascus sp. VKM F-4520 (FW-2644)]